MSVDSCCNINITVIILFWFLFNVSINYTRCNISIILWLNYLASLNSANFNRRHARWCNIWLIASITSNELFHTKVRLCTILEIS
jgi:hypothetical protein